MERYIENFTFIQSKIRNRIKHDLEAYNCSTEEFIAIEKVLHDNPEYSKVVMCIEYINGKITCHNSYNNHKLLDVKLNESIKDRWSNIEKLLDQMSTYMSKYGKTVPDMLFYVFIGNGEYPDKLRNLPIMCVSRLSDQNAILMPLNTLRNKKNECDVTPEIAIFSNCKTSDLETIKHITNLPVREFSIRNNSCPSKYTLNMYCNSTSIERSITGGLLIDVAYNNRSETFYDNIFIAGSDYIEVPNNKNITELALNIGKVINELESDPLKYNKLVTSYNDKTQFVGSSLVYRSLYSLLIHFQSKSVNSGAPQNMYELQKVNPNVIKTSYSSKSTKFLEIVLNYLKLSKTEKRNAPIGKFLYKFMKWIKWDHDSRILSCKNDTELYSILSKIYKSCKINIPDSKNNREDYRAHSINEVLELANAKVHGAKYLDYGANGCLITDAVAHLLDVQPWACDIPNWSGMDNSCANKRITYADLQDGKIPVNESFPDTFELITVLMVLHHIPSDNLKLSVENIVSRLSKGGYLVVREHDVTNDFTDNVCHFEHAMYDIVLGKISPEWFFNNYIGNYHSLQYWIHLIESFCMKLLYKSIPLTIGKYAFMVFKKE